MIQEDSLAYIVPITITHTLMTVVGIVGNSLIMVAIAVWKPLRTPGNLFIVNLAVCDMLVSAVTNPFSVVATIHGGSYFIEHDVMCRVVGSICMISCQASCATILHISVNRYVAIVHNEKYAKFYTWRNSALLCLATWILFILYNIPTHTGGGTDLVYDEKFKICIWSRKPEHYAYRNVYVTLCVVIPLIFVIVLYVLIFKYVTKKNKAAIAESRRHGHKAKMTPQEGRSARLSRTLFIIAITFVICWTLIGVVVIFDVRGSWPDEIYVVSVTIAHISSSGVNSIIYGATNRQFRRAYRRAFGVICRKRFENDVSDVELRIRVPAIFSNKTNVTRNLTCTRKGACTKSM